MRTLLEMINVGGSGLLTAGGLAMIWGIAREGRRAHAVDASPMGPVGSPDGLEPAGGGGSWGSAGQAVRDALRALRSRYMAAEGYLGARTPDWVGLPWLRMRRTVRRGRHYGAERARRARGALATCHRTGSTNMVKLHKQLREEAARILAERPVHPRSAVLWAEGVLS